MPADIWDIYKQQNQETVVGPYLLFPYDDPSYGEASLNLVNRYITLSDQYMEQYQKTVMKSEDLSTVEYMAEAYTKLLATDLIKDNLSVSDETISGEEKTALGISRLYVEYLTALSEASQ